MGEGLVIEEIEVDIRIQVEKINIIAGEAVKFTESNESVWFESCEPEREP